MWDFDLDIAGIRIWLLELEVTSTSHQKVQTWFLAWHLFLQLYLFDLDIAGISIWRPKSENPMF